MEILVAAIKDNKYCFEWTKVDIKNSFNDGKCEFSSKMYGRYNSNNIWGVRGDIRTGKDVYVRCEGCKQIIKLSDFKKHCDIRESQRNCSECSKLSMGSMLKDRTITKVDTEAGKVQTIRRVTSTAMCSVGMWKTVPINSDFDKEHFCVFYACRRKGYSELPEDYFTICKTPFLKIITIKSLYDNGWKPCGDCTSSTWQYKKTNLFASTNGCGIVYKFYYNGKNGRINFRYADKTNAFLTEYGTRCIKVDPKDIFPNGSLEKFELLFKQLYK